MGIEFILGRQSSDREELLINRLKSVMDGDPLQNVLFVVPPQATYSMEQMLMEKLGVSGLMGVDVTSLSRIVSRILEEVQGTEARPVSAAGRSMAARLVMDREGVRLKALGVLKRHQEVPPLVAEAVTELKRLDITPDMLRQFDTGDEKTNTKFHDIACIYEGMGQKLEGYMDAEDRMDFAAACVPQADFIRQSHIFIHGFDMYNSKTMRFITQMMHVAKHTVMTFLSAPKGAADSGVYGICDENRILFYDAVRDLGVTETVANDNEERSSDILHVERNVFAYPTETKRSAGGVSVSYAADMREEVDGVAAQVAYLTQGKGWRFCDVAIVCGSAPAYLGLIRERFGKSNIPCYTGEKRSLIKSNIADFTLTAFDLARGRLKKRTVLAHAMAGFCNIDRGKTSTLTNYAYTRFRDGFAFLKPFDGVEEEAARAALMQPIENLRKRVEKVRTARGLIDGVLAYFEELDVRAKVEAQAAAMRESGLLAEADFAEQAYERIGRVLEQAGEIIEDGLDAAGFARALAAGMAAEEISVIPPAVDEVFCGDIQGSYLPDVRALFVMGANEGSIPDYSATGDIFSEAERAMLLSGVAGLRHAGGMDKQKLAIVKALSRPRERLFLSCVSDGSMQRSPVLDRITDMLEGVKTNRMADIAPMLAQNAFELTARCVRNAADGHANVCGAPGAVAAVLSGGLGDETGKIQKALETENHAERIGGLAGDLYGTYTPSATRIESFYGCPYRHFVRYGVRAAQAREYNIDRLDVGRFAHDVLDMAAKQVQDTGWDHVDEAALRKAVQESAVQAAESDPRYRLNAHNKAVLDAVTDEIVLAAEMIRQQSKKGALRPAKTEYEFRLDAPAVMGKVDRIDTAEEGGRRYFGIVDYKTGASDFDINRMAEGLDLQLIIYVIAVRALMGDNYAFAGANYMRIFSALREQGEPLEPLFKMRGIAGVPAEDARRLFGEDDKGGLFSVAARYKKDGNYDSASQQRSYTEEELDILAGWAVRLIGQARTRIEDGETAISPTEDGKHGLACVNCEFGDVCAFEAGMDEPRPIENEGKEARVAQMRAVLEAADETN